MEDQNVVVASEKASPVALISFICGLVSAVCLNPCYLTSVAAIVLGIVGLAKNKNPKWMSITGIAVGAGAIIVWLILDTIMAPFTLGLTYFF